jgi:hypothetical protein
MPRKPNNTVMPLTRIQYHNITKGYISFERVELFKCLRKPKQIKIAPMKKLTAEGTQGMFAIIRCIIFCLPVYYPKI